MKKLLFLFILMLSPMLASAQTVSDVKNSGCLNETRGVESQRVPTIVLTKEGSVLSVQLLNYEENCCVEEFEVTSNISGGSNGVPLSLSISVGPVAEMDCDCICPFNVSFTVRDLEPNSFYLDCWWYKGIVNLTEGQPLVLEDITLNATIDGVNYTLKKTLGTATLTKVVEQKKKMLIPAELNYEGQTYAVKTIVYNSFRDCSTIKELDIPESISAIYDYSFYGCKLETLIIRGFLESHYINSNLLYGLGTDMILYVQPSEVEKYKAIYKGPVYSLPEQAVNDMAYRPFIEEGKVWVIKCGAISPYGLLESWVEYCYLDGDTIIGGQTCKQMKCLKNGNLSPLYIGAWYEQDKKVYFAGNNIERDDMGAYFAGDRPQFELLYDFTLSSGDIVNRGDNMYVVQKMSGGITGFKGTYYELRRKDNRTERWLEGVGSESLPYINYPHSMIGIGGTLLACIVGDEVIYYNNEENDSFVLGARKDRIDFTHTIKIKPKSRTAREAEAKSLYGEYNSQQLGINLNALDEAYQVSITDEAGKAVYEKTVNAGSIVGLNIDISAYAKGRYTVTVENSNESFTGQFETLATGIEENVRIEKFKNGSIYNLQGQRINSLRKGLNIVNGRKVYKY